MGLIKTQPPREVARSLERYARLPSSDVESFAGYGIMGLPFANGHILALRRFPETAFGGYTCVWHRTPAGEWTFYSDGEPARSCARYFGSELKEALVAEIELHWTGPASLSVSVPSVEIEWEVRFTATWTTRLMNLMARYLPKTLWRNPHILRLMSWVGTHLLGSGRIGLVGHYPNGQRFLNNPFRLWMVSDSRASFRGEDLGPMGSVDPQAHLRDYWIPQRGILAYGQVLCEPLDPSQHSVQVSGTPEVVGQR